MQNTNNEQTSSPNLDDGLELLKKVIQSNEENVEMGIRLNRKIEALNNTVDKLEYTIRVANDNIKLLEVIKDNFFEHFRQLIETMPGSIDTHLSRQSFTKIDELYKELKKTNKNKNYGKKLMLFTLSIFALSVLLVFLCFYFSKQWYDTSIQTKMEIRTELLQEIKNDKKEIYNQKDVEQLQYNTELINKWMKKNPKDAEKFLKFKDGYEAR
ncbi:hypothetical protein PG279_06865 [Riemerella anatipestifer]|nr:hypothetical protein [Riemerella anatipestifer]